jgi:soluble lytic murein transglycosylase-like protein
MSSGRLVRIAPFAVILLFAPERAAAEIAVLSSGRTLSIASHRTEGDTLILALRGGGEMRCETSLVREIVPDEVPFPEPAPVSAPAATVPAPPALPVTPYTDIITTLSRAHGVDPVLVQALIQVESAYKPRARSHKGAMGLMQLMPATARAYRVRNPYDPAANVAAGVKHLKSLIDRWGVELALAAYNAGEAAVRKFNGIPPYRDTRDYVSRILSLAGRR